MILVFAGAGASKATSPNKFPTTVDFYRMLPKEIREDEMFIAVDSYIRMNKGNLPNTQVDVEEILWTMDDLYLEADAFANGNNLLGRFLHQNQVRKTFGDTYKLADLAGLSKDIAKKILELSQKINRMVFNLYAELPTEDELNSCWIPLFETLLKDGERVEIFTTNYDQVIEAALELIEKKTKS